MICFPNAKINLGLHVVSRRPDGYHDLETIFYPIGLKDALEIIPTSETRFFQTGNPIEGPSDNNLVIKALRMITAERKLPEMDIHLLKKIPSGAGLGGGSSDAAFMLNLLNDTFKLEYTREELMMRAARLGADCPFFIINKPAYATGIGDKLEPIEVDLSRYTLLLVKPDVRISTKEAYAMITPHKPELSLKEIITQPPETWRDLMKNDFELPVFKKFPEICKIRQQLYEMGAIYASMSGSGSALFGLFEKEPDWKEAFGTHFIWSGKVEK
ncbi:4-(cytidine 5'-diphospho)-2-C-methyl-D-erythritol kinase [Proteiniphilum sp. UBA5384]|uniref:4-(cytidine 5'-diphospho)-2-C-methyl-D-erythritol kinase n=1 Tax=Proteiniphilum sp. UBA5384 TaxID=1947279 RepID=UPI0025FFA515|nr:4-(cytidine 5'-diphospho)-2-C-methyl-D-erythritol kinase [Proteiniphilum sp. UBA5384]